MPKCSYPGGCEDYTQQKSDRCSKHQANQAQRKLESAAVRKLQMEQAEADRRAKEQDERNKAAQKKLDQQLRLQAYQAEVMAKHRQVWNAQIDHVVAQVLVLRQTDPNADAGYNAVGDTLGGNKNPVKLVTTGAMHGVTKGDILATMHGLDGSDSGLFKFRRSLVMVHCE